MQLKEWNEKLFDILSTQANEIRLETWSKGIIAFSKACSVIDCHDKIPQSIYKAIAIAAKLKLCLPPLQVDDLAASASEVCEQFDLLSHIPKIRTYLNCELLPSLPSHLEFPSSNPESHTFSPSIATLLAKTDPFALSQSNYLKSSSHSAFNIQDHKHVSLNEATALSNSITTLESKQ